MEKMQMNEPLVIPKPKIKPSPKRQTPPKTKPKENDPWTVPAPKVNPTPKAINTVMKRIKKYINGKIVINTKSDLDVMRSMMSKEAFDKKCILTIKLVTELLAEDAMTYVAFTDVSPLYVNKKGMRGIGLN